MAASKKNGSPIPEADGSSPKTQSFEAQPEICIDFEKSYKAHFKTTHGDFSVQLDAKKAPLTVNNFVFLARYHYYDDVIFHRIIPGFVVQGGDPKGTGMGGPGYRFRDELPNNGEYEIGSLAMANAGPNTNGSQFFIVTGPAGEALPPKYSIFGQVTSGMNVVNAISADGSASGTPKVVHKMLKVTITTK